MSPYSDFFLTDGGVVPIHDLETIKKSTLWGSIHIGFNRMRKKDGYGFFVSMNCHMNWNTIQINQDLVWCYRTRHDWVRDMVLTNLMKN
jgi:hypothetical protein